MKTHSAPRISGRGARPTGALPRRWGEAECFLSYSGRLGRAWDHSGPRAPAASFRGPANPEGACWSLGSQENEGRRGSGPGAPGGAERGSSEAGHVEPAPQGWTLTGAPSQRPKPSERSADRDSWRGGMVGQGRLRGRLCGRGSWPPVRDCNPLQGWRPVHGAATLLQGQVWPQSDAVD